MMEVLHWRLMLRRVEGSIVMLPTRTVVFIGMVLLVMVEVLLLLVVHLQPAHVELQWNKSAAPTTQLNWGVLVLDVERCRYPEGHGHCVPDAGEK